MALDLTRRLGFRPPSYGWKDILFRCLAYRGCVYRACPAGATNEGYEMRMFRLESGSVGVGVCTGGVTVWVGVRVHAESVGAERIETSETKRGSSEVCVVLRREEHTHIYIYIS